MMMVRKKHDVRPCRVGRHRRVRPHHDVRGRSAVRRVRRPRRLDSHRPWRPRRGHCRLRRRVLRMRHDLLLLLLRVRRHGTVGHVAAGWILDGARPGDGGIAGRRHSDRARRSRDALLLLLQLLLLLWSQLMVLRMLLLLLWPDLHVMGKQVRHCSRYLLLLLLWGDNSNLLLQLLRMLLLLLIGRRGMLLVYHN